MAIKFATGLLPIPSATDMTLPMVTCPLCCRPGFSTSDSLCSALVDVTTRKLCCPICNHIVFGLDKLTIHLLSHSLNKFGIDNANCPAQICHSKKEAETYLNIKSSNNGLIDVEVGNNSSNLNNSIVKLQNTINGDTFFKAPDAMNIGKCGIVQNDLQFQKSLNIPESSLICFRTENGQIFALSPESIGNNLKNVTINTQNYITNTNITTSSVKANVIEKVHKRKYSQVFEHESFENNKNYDVQEGSDNYSNFESVNSWPSQSSVSSETDKQTIHNTLEKEFESCRDLLTKGDFSTLNDDMCELDFKRESVYSDISLNDEGNDDLDDKKEELKKKDGLNCELCPYVFPNKTILAMHKQLIHKKVEVEIENKRKLLVCNMCPRTFSLRSSLMIHRRVAHAGGFGNNENCSFLKEPASKPSCHICGKFFKKEIHLAQHMKAHDEKQWQCTICSKTFTTKYFLKKHRRLHTGETPYKCTTCSKSFTFQQSYHKHLLYHNDEKPYCCAQCGRLFKELSTLHNHERIHSGEKPFTCETCGKSFRQRVSYLVHRRIHTGVMPYKCTACNKSFRYKISQRTHKCPAQPPGVVVRTSGSLVERLQAAINKASEDNGDKRSCTGSVNSPNVLEVKESQSGSNESQISLKKATEDSSTKAYSLKTKTGTSTCSTDHLLKNNTHAKSSDVENVQSHKPQIYLLVKGPNEETYYQPLVFSQNINTPLNYVQDIIPSPKSKNSKHLKSKYKQITPDSTKQPGNDTDIICTTKLHSNETKMEASKTEDSFGSQRTPEDQNTTTIRNDEMGRNENYSCAENSNWPINYRKSIDTKSAEKCDQPSFTNECSDSAMCDILKHLTGDSLDVNVDISSNVRNPRSEPNCDMTMMDPTEIFSLILSPTLSSPSDQLGKLTISPSCSNQQHLSLDGFDPPGLFYNNNIEIHQDPLFDNISDDALKEFIFGSSQ